MAAPLGLHVHVNAVEMGLLNAYCAEVARSKTEIVRELIRSLPAQRKLSPAAKLLGQSHEAA